MLREDRLLILQERQTIALENIAYLLARKDETANIYKGGGCGIGDAREDLVIIGPPEISYESDGLRFYDYGGPLPDETS